MSKQKIVNEGGIIGKGEGLVNQNSKDFKLLQEIINGRSNELNKTDSIINRLLSIRFQMESYLYKEHSGELIKAGTFLENFISVLNIKKKDFAEYIDYKESNLSAVFKGRRKINIDLAIKLGEIFRVDPVLWLHIQSKNELREFIDSDNERYKKYKLEDLLKEVN
ncbi:MAG: helix-turn-helix domain-containing protein [Bacteroidota bacterium]